VYDNIAIAIDWNSNFHNPDDAPQERN